MTVGIPITFDDVSGEQPSVAVARANRSALVAEAIRDHLDRRAVVAAAEWHASLEGEDAAVFAEFGGGGVRGGALDTGTGASRPRPPSESIASSPSW